MKKINILLAGLALTLIGGGFVSKNASKTVETVNADTFTYVDNSVTNVAVIKGYNVAQRFLLITLDHTDYNLCDHVDYNLDVGNLYNWRDIADFGDQITIDGNHFEVIGYNTYFRYYSNNNTIGILLDESVWTKIGEGSEIVVPTGTLFPTYNVMFGGGDQIYKTTESVSFTYSNGRFRKATSTTPVDSSVTSIDLTQGYNGMDTYLRFFIDGNDYVDIPNTDEFNHRNDFKLLPIPDSHIVNMSYNISNFGAVIKYKGNAVNFEDTDTFLNYRCIHDEYGNIAIKFTQTLSTFNSGDEIIVPKDTTFPSFGCLIGENDTVYKTTADKVFTYYQGSFHACEDYTGEEYITNGTSHWKECSVCGKHVGEGNHNIVEGNKAPTCTEPGYDDCEYCSVCGYVAKDGTPVDALGHDFSGAYQFDEEHHWKVCQREGCNEVSLDHEHCFDEDPTHRHCDECEYERNVAIITVNHGYLNELDSNIILIGKTVTVIADAPENGKAFEGWYSNGEKISDLNTYTFEVTETLTLEARYKDAPVEPEEPEEPVTPEEPTEEKGCGGSVIASSILVTSLPALGIALVFKKKHK